MATYFQEKRLNWAFQREETWFTEMWANRNDLNNHDTFKADFRVNLSTFADIIRLVERRLSKRDTKFRKAIPIEKRVGIALWRLGTGNSYRYTKTLLQTIFFL